jgi:hypothetical protein
MKLKDSAADFSVRYTNMTATDSRVRKYKIDEGGK